MWVIIIQRSQNVEVFVARSQTNEVPGIFSNRNVFGFSVFRIQVNFFSHESHRRRRRQRRQRRRRCEES